jgi:hypothetical protein
LTKRVCFVLKERRGRSICLRRAQETGIGEAAQKRDGKSFERNRRLDKRNIDGNGIRMIDSVETDGTIIVALSVLMVME